MPFLVELGLDWLGQDPGPGGAVLQGIIFGRTAPHRSERRTFEATALVIGHPRDSSSAARVLEHLQGFKKSRMQHSAEILALLGQVELHGSDRLVERIVAAEEFVALPGGSSVDDQPARRQAELLERWEGLRAWFVGDEDSGPPCGR